MPHQPIITAEAIKRRAYWIQEIKKLSGKFADDAERLEKGLATEVQKLGNNVLLDHLRLCGDIPECYGHDSSEEKLYSKYTDCLLSEAYKSLGLTSVVLKERADVADVEVVAKDYSFVADAKSFRLSRTAKNQKDFKVAALDGWKHGKPYAMVVCPIYQLPIKSSQIYAQAISRNVCIFTYSHLTVLTAFSLHEDMQKAQALLKNIFETVGALNPSKDAGNYWSAVNRAMLGFSKNISTFWQQEKLAATESITIAKQEALTFIAQEREKIMRMSREDAIHELIKAHKLENKTKIITSVIDNGILGMK